MPEHEADRHFALEHDADTQGLTPREEGAGSAQATPRPAYRKPVVRRYDQIEQVKPYGPSEKQAG